MRPERRVIERLVRANAGGAFALNDQAFFREAEHGQLRQQLSGPTEEQELLLPNAAGFESLRRDHAAT
jgi:hypothetical protein